MRLKIQQLASDAGYKGSPVVSRLLSRFRSRSGLGRGSLAVVHTSPNPMDRTVPTVRAWVAAAVARAQEAGYACDEYSLQNGVSGLQRVASILEARGVSGLLLTGPFRGCTIPANIQSLCERRPVVVLGERPFAPAYSCVLNDQFATALQAVEQLCGLAYRRPGLCIHPDLDAVLQMRFRGGFLAAQQSLPARNRIPVFDFHPGARREFAAWFKKTRPDVLLTTHKEIRDWLPTARIQDGSQTGLAHLDRTDDLLGWAGMRQDHTHLGSAAVDLLLNQIHFHISGTPPFQQCVMIGSRWMHGESVRRAG